MEYIGQNLVYKYLSNAGIEFEYYEHPESPTIEIARQYYRGEGAVLCKNLFFRNKKGDKHYLVIMDSEKNMDIHGIEKQLHEGKLTFASAERLEKYLGVKHGSVSLFSLINDKNHEVILYVDKGLLDVQKVSFHPNDCRASLTIKKEDMIRFIEKIGNVYEYREL